MKKSCRNCGEICSNAGSDVAMSCRDWTGHAKKLTARQVLNRIEKATLTMDVPSIRRYCNQLRREC